MCRIHTEAARLDLDRAEIALLEVLRDPQTLVESGWPALVRAVEELAAAARDQAPRGRPLAVRTEPNQMVRHWFGQLTVDLSRTR